MIDWVKKMLGIASPSHTPTPPPIWATELFDDVWVIPKHGVWEVDGVNVYEAIEKQKPKKPKEFDDTYVFGRCECGEILVSIFGNKRKYCPNCGQKVDWGRE